MAESGNGRVLSVGATARCLGVDRATVRRWADDGMFEGAMRTPGGHWRLPIAGVARVRDGMKSASGLPRLPRLRDFHRSKPAKP